MWPWEDEPRSLADGILDDETYDWLGVVQGMAASGGSPVVVERGPDRGGATTWPSALTGIPVSATGTAGLAGLLALRSEIDRRRARRRPLHRPLVLTRPQAYALRLRRARTGEKRGRR